MIADDIAPHTPKHLGVKWNYRCSVPWLVIWFEIFWGKCVCFGYKILCSHSKFLIMIANDIDPHASQRMNNGCCAIPGFLIEERSEEEDCSEYRRIEDARLCFWNWELEDWFEGLKVKGLACLRAHKVRRIVARCFLNIEAWLRTLQPRIRIRKESLEAMHVITIFL